MLFLLFCSPFGLQQFFSFFLLFLLVFDLKVYLGVLKEGNNDNDQEDRAGHYHSRIHYFSARLSQSSRNDSCYLYIALCNSDRCLEYFCGVYGLYRPGTRSFLWYWFLRTCHYVCELAYSGRQHSFCSGASFWSVVGDILCAFGLDFLTRP